MKLCSECRKTPWPCAFAIFIAGLSAFLTWLMLSFSGFSESERLMGSALMFVLASATLLHYVLSCMKRHCRHDRHGDHTRHHHHHPV